MWNNFQKVLEKRVNKKRIIKNDKYLVIKISEDIFNNFFGEISQRFIKIKDYKNETLWIVCENSIWRNEIKLNGKELIEKINKKSKEDLIGKLILI